MIFHSYQFKFYVGNHYITFFYNSQGFFALAGFGATFGPLMVFSLFWKRMTRAGTIAGMVGGAGMVFLWKLCISKLGGLFAIYELLPAFIFSALCIVAVSLLTSPPPRRSRRTLKP